MRNSQPTKNKPKTKQLNGITWNKGRPDQREEIKSLLPPLTTQGWLQRSRWPEPSSGVAQAGFSAVKPPLNTPLQDLQGITFPLSFSNTGQLDLTPFFFSLITNETP